MKKFIKKYVKEIICVILFLLGVLFLVVGKNNFVQGGLSCACWAGCVFVMRTISKQKGIETINCFDKEVQEILKDIEINGTNSEYYGVVDINIINKQRLKFVKKVNKESISFAILGIILIIICILCVI